MVYFKWEDQYSLGIEFIDEQHKSLVKLINILHGNLAEGTTDEIIDETLSSLIDYTVYHFNSEEEMLKTYGYPSYQDHKKHHDALAQQILDIQKNIQNRSSDLSHDVTDFLVHWLVAHIVNEDKQYLQYFKDNNIFIEKYIGKLIK